ncbi:MAG: fibronectin type III domain-containing protein, partial [Isosphaeraceae bacterium]
TVGATVTSYTDKSVKRNTAYEYRVAAYNSAGDSAWSNVATATTPKTAQKAKPGSTYPDGDIPIYIAPGDLRRWQRRHKHQRDDG